ncbi:hypothetical protein [Paraburkholderia solisilvae]|uniref:Uncharacterized protein n=1 Tax=Paraburkholderia solisilvae TaxID=624376 RepID=A0A6J5E5Q7_9BURK|nr:hypothetical protein [Paraburkholderia solisilvae]CAB3761849.1 hypothetical protein LMG29739_03737 [Paraburkholderia solisilvae]
MSQTGTIDPRDAHPVRNGSNLMAYLHVLKKAHAVMVGHARAEQRFRQIVTYGEAQRYIEELMPLLLRECDSRWQQRRRTAGG